MKKSPISVAFFLFCNPFVTFTNTQIPCIIELQKTQRRIAMFNYGYPTPSYLGGTGYQSTYPQRQNVQPQMPMQPQPQAQPQMQMPMEMPIQDIRYVNKAQAEAYILYPNTKVMLIDKDSGIVYLKTADNTGLCKTDYFKFEPINADGTPIQPKEETPKIDMGEYIKKSDLEKYGFVTIQQLDNAIQRLTSQQNKPMGAKSNGTGTKQSQTIEKN